MVLEGNATVDESMITGESIPVAKIINNNVIGGTILQSGNIKVRATNVGSDTLLSNIIELVKDAQNHKPKIQKLGDKISSIFVPLVLIISLLTYFISPLILIPFSSWILVNSNLLEKDFNSDTKDFAIGWEE